MVCGCGDGKCSCVSQSDVYQVYHIAIQGPPQGSGTWLQLIPAPCSQLCHPWSTLHTHKQPSTRSVCKCTYTNQGALTCPSSLLDPAQLLPVCNRLRHRTSPLRLLLSRPNSEVRQQAIVVVCMCSSGDKSWRGVCTPGVAPLSFGAGLVIQDVARPTTQQNEAAEHKDAAKE